RCGRKSVALRVKDFPPDAAATTTLPVDWQLVGFHLIVAFAGGALVSGIYSLTRPRAQINPSFPPTLVLLSILIAMVTQVIGDQLARAFSLVGVLSIVRFRTVVRDTQDTAFVIFAVAIGMAIGANHPSVALCGLAVVGGAALLLRKRGATIAAPSDEQLPFALHVRMA